MTHRQQILKLMQSEPGWLEHRWQLIDRVQELELVNWSLERRIEMLTEELAVARTRERFACFKLGKLSRAIRDAMTRCAAG
jgi:hypothetical protein